VTAQTGELRSQQVARALAVLGDLAQTERSLAGFTTYRLGGPAAIFVEASTIVELGLVAEAQRVSGLKVLVVGRGSNLLVDDAGFHGIALRLAGRFDQITLLDSVNDLENDLEGDLADEGSPITDGAISQSPGEGVKFLRIGAAVALPVVARRTAAMGLRGMEWAVGVPGSVGGAVRMNAGGHGSDMAASLFSVEIFDLTTHQIYERPAEDLGLRFRGSDLTDSEVVVSAVVKLESGSVHDCTEQIAAIVQWRREHQPGGQNCGSVFVNPVPGELSAGELIDRCGLRGERRGGAVVSMKHANFIQAEESATAADVRALIEHVRQIVERETGFCLRSEVRIIGPEGEQ
jgi:UDP-N-acetylmuramate dehydrogenase